MTTTSSVEDRPRVAKAWQVVSASGRLTDDVDLMATELPELHATDVEIAVEAAAIGFPDMLLATGSYHDRPAMPFTLGAEAAGVVTAAGARANIAVGSRVIVVPGHVATGLLADKLVVPAERVLPVPDGMPMVEAAAFTSAYQTSFIGLDRRCHLAEGETLLVFGASGGIGSAAIEIGRARGCRVIAVTRGADKARFCADLGADTVIDLARDDDVVTQVRSVTNGSGADVVFDPVGGSATAAARRCVALEGRLLIVGFASGEVPQVPVNHALLKNYSIVGFRTWPFRGDSHYRSTVHEQLCAMYLRRQLRPRVEQIEFGDVPAGLQRLADRQVCGRLVATIGGES